MVLGHDVQIFKTKLFVRFARGERIDEKSLIEAVERAGRGLVDADLGGGVIKQRVARQGQGRSAAQRGFTPSPQGPESQWGTCSPGLGLFGSQLCCRIQITDSDTNPKLSSERLAGLMQAIWCEELPPKRLPPEAPLLELLTKGSFNPQARQAAAEALALLVRGNSAFVSRAALTLDAYAYDRLWPYLTSMSPGVQREARDCIEARHASCRQTFLEANALSSVFAELACV